MAKAERPKFERPKVERPTMERKRRGQADDTPMPNDDEDNPFDGMDIEAEAAAEVSETLQKFRDRAAAADKRFVDNTDSEYWVAFCFQNREQKEEFLRETGLIDLGDKYIDGMAAARILKRPLKTPAPKIPRFGHDHKLERLAPTLDQPYPKKKR